MAELSQERIHALFEYEAETGHLIWKVRPRSDFILDHHHRNWNRIYAGTRAGCVCPRSRYRVITIKGKVYREHRIIWCHVYGDVSVEQIDHINGIRDDNRLVNLRAVDSAVNRKNTSLRSNNRTGFHGIYQLENGKWVSRITSNYKRIHLGTFQTKEEAICARKKFEKRLGYHKNHGRPPQLNSASY